MDAASAIRGLAVALFLVTVALGLGMWQLARYCAELSGRINRMAHLIAEHAVVLAALNGGEEHPYVAKLREATGPVIYSTPAEQAAALRREADAEADPLEACVLRAVAAKIEAGYVPSIAYRMHGLEHPYVAKLRQAGVLGDVAVPPEQAEDLGPV